MISVSPYHDAKTRTVTYLVADLDSKQCAIIDPVLDFDVTTGRVGMTHINNVLAQIDDEELELRFVLETHVHADHLTAASYVRENRNVPIVIGEGVSEVIKNWYEYFGFDSAILDAPDFDFLVNEQSTLRLGKESIKVIMTPGHTPSCVTYLIGDCAFVGDLMFAPQTGCGRCDFKGGSARTLFRSVKKLWDLDDDTRIYVGHDYPKVGQKVHHYATIKEHLKENVMVGQGISEDEFVKIREKRDAKLPPPKLLIPSLQVNLQAGRLGFSEKNGHEFLKIPLDLSDDT